MASTSIGISVNGTQTVTATLDQVEAGMDSVARKAAEVQAKTGNAIPQSVTRSLLKLDEARQSVMKLAGGASILVGAFAGAYSATKKLYALWDEWAHSFKEAGEAATRNAQQIAQAADYINRTFDHINKSAADAARDTALAASADKLKDAAFALERARGRGAAEDRQRYDLDTQLQTALNRQQELTAAQRKEAKALWDKQQGLEQAERTARQLLKAKEAEVAAWNRENAARALTEKGEKELVEKQKQQKKELEALQAAAQRATDLRIAGEKEILLLQNQQEAARLNAEAAIIQQRDRLAEYAADKERERKDAEAEAQRKAEEEQRKAAEELRKQERQAAKNRLRDIDLELSTLRSRSGTSDRRADWMAANSYAAATISPLSDASRQSLMTQKEISAKISTLVDEQRKLAKTIDEIARY